MPAPVYETEKVASTKPSSGRKKNCTPRAACSAVSAVGLVGLLAELPRAVDVNMRVASFTKIVEASVPAASLPTLARSGVT